VSPLEFTVAPEGAVRWLHHYTDPYAPSMETHAAASTIMSSWIIPVPSARGQQWYYHARFRGCGPDARHLVAALAGIIAIPPLMPLSAPTDPDLSVPDVLRTMIDWECNPDLPRNEFLHMFADAPVGDPRIIDQTTGHLGLWRVPYTADTGTKWRYHCRFHDVADDGRISGMRIEGVVVVEYPTAVPLQVALPPFRRRVTHASKV